MDEKEKKDRDKRDENSPENAPEISEEEVKEDAQAETPESETGGSEPSADTSEELQTAEETPEKEPETESLKAENIRLKAQIEAYKAGFRADVLEDAVLLASAVSERDGTDISAALSAVAKKYPDWKSEKTKGDGLKIGADSPKENTDDSRFDEALGIRKRGK